MVGMLQILTYLLCVYLVYKAVEIFQIALMSSKEGRGTGLFIGTIAIIASLVIGALFVYLIDTQAASVSSGL